MLSHIKNNTKKMKNSTAKGVKFSSKQLRKTQKKNLLSNLTYPESGKRVSDRQSIPKPTKSIQRRLDNSDVDDRLISNATERKVAESQVTLVG